MTYTQFKLEIDISNAAFGDHPCFEIGRCLVAVGAKVVDHHVSGPIKDSNGNQVGVFWFEEEEK